MAYRLCVIIVALTLCGYASMFTLPGTWTRYGGQDYWYGYPWKVIGVAGDTRSDFYTLRYWNLKHLTMNMLFWGVPIASGATTLIVIHSRRRFHAQTSKVCPKCKYDLRGSIGRTQCPECGRTIEWSGDDEVSTVEDKIHNQG
jgi:hypothetical protein